MSPMQLVVLTVFTLVTFANTFLLQPDVALAPVVHAAVVSADVALFWLALNLKQFADMGRKPGTPEIIAPPDPKADLAVVEKTLEATLPSPPAA